MFERLARKLRGLRVEAVPFDPSALGDELALRTEWTPARGGGASFRTHRLVRVGSERMELRATRGARAFYLVFLLAGLGLVAGAALTYLDASPAPDAGALAMMLLVGGVFTVVGGKLYYHGAAPVVFDRRRGEYWKGRVAPYEVANPDSLEQRAELDRVRALQIVSERVRSKNSSYYSYELNLVLDDGTRLNVVDHGNLERLREDARALGDFLGRPVWDATS